MTHEFKIDNWLLDTQSAMTIISKDLFYFIFLMYGGEEI